MRGLFRTTGAMVNVYQDDFRRLPCWPDVVSGSCTAVSVSPIHVWRMEDEWRDCQRIVPEEVLVLAFVLEGKVLVSIPGETDRTIDSGNWFFVANSDAGTSLRLPSDVSGLLLSCSLPFFRTLLTERDDVPAKLSCLNCPLLERVVFTFGSTTGCLGDLVRCVLAEDPSRFGAQFTIGRHAFDLLASVFELPQFGSGCCCREVHRKEDLKAIENVAAHLCERFSEEHSLQKLCSRFHINEFKLKKGFREHYGRTVFQYLRRRRMEYARHRFSEGAPSVMEVACEVGYSNPSHFARAFRQEFGSSPRELLLKGARLQATR